MVITIAEENLIEVKDGIARAISGLSEIIVDHVWGWDDYNAEYRMRLTEAFVSLLALREKIGIL